MSGQSWMVVAANDERRLRGTLTKSCDAVVLDLSCCDEMERPAARRLAADWLGAHRTQVLESRKMARWVRIGAMGEGRHWRDDLLAVLPAAPDGIVLPRAAGPDQVRQLAAELYEIEQKSGLTANSTRLLPVVGETAASALQVRRFVEDGHQRIAGLTWNPGALARSLGAKRAASQLGKWSQVFAHVRSEMLLTAHACGIAAIDALPPACDDAAQIAKLAKLSAEEGFTGMMVARGEHAALVKKAFSDCRPDDAESDDKPAAFKRRPALGTFPRRDEPQEQDSGPPPPVLRPA